MIYIDKARKTRVRTSGETRKETDEAVPPSPLLSPPPCTYRYGRDSRRANMMKRAQKTPPRGCITCKHKCTYIYRSTIINSEIVAVLGSCIVKRENKTATFHIQFVYQVSYKQSFITEPILIPLRPGEHRKRVMEACLRIRLDCTPAFCIK